MAKRLSQLGLVLFGVLLSWLGIRVIADARPAAPVSASGILARHESRPETILGVTYLDAADIWITREEPGDLGPYRFHPAELHPSVPDMSARIGAAMTVWYDRGTSNMIAVRLDGTLYSTDYFEHPRSKYWDLVARGLVLGSPGFVILAGFGIWAFRKTRPRVNQAGPTTGRAAVARFRLVSPRDLTRLPGPPSEILADFQQALARTKGSRARPESLLANEREEIIVALFDDVKRRRGIIPQSEITELKQSLKELQTFVPADDAALVARYDDAEQRHDLRSLPRSDRDRARAIVERIGAGQSGVANFRYDEPEYLGTGETFMIEETRKWSEPTGAGEALEDSSTQAVGCLVYAGFGLTALILYLAGEVRWGSMQFWGLAAGTLAALTLAMLAAPWLNKSTAGLADLPVALRRVGSGLMVTLLIGTSVAICLLLARVLNAIPSRF